MSFQMTLGDPVEGIAADAPPWIRIDTVNRLLGQWVGNSGVAGWMAQDDGVDAAMSKALDHHVQAAQGLRPWSDLVLHCSPQNAPVQLIAGGDGPTEWLNHGDDVADSASDHPHAPGWLNRREERLTTPGSGSAGLAQNKQTAVAAQAQQHMEPVWTRPCTR